MMLDAEQDPGEMWMWTANGGEATLNSYYARDWTDVPAHHLVFLRQTVLFHQTETAIFIHANYDADSPLQGQDEEVMLWRHLVEHPPGPHISGKTALVGRTPMRDEPFDVTHLGCLETGCEKGGPLTAMDVETREFWIVMQADERQLERNQRSATALLPANRPSAGPSYS